MILQTCICFFFFWVDMHMFVNAAYYVLFRLKKIRIVFLLGHKFLGRIMHFVLIYSIRDCLVDLFLKHIYFNLLLVESIIQYEFSFSWWVWTRTIGSSFKANYDKIIMIKNLIFTNSKRYANRDLLCQMRWTLYL